MWYTSSYSILGKMVFLKWTNVSLDRWMPDPCGIHPSRARLELREPVPSSTTNRPLKGRYVGGSRHGYFPEQHFLGHNIYVWCLVICQAFQVTPSKEKEEENHSDNRQRAQVLIFTGDFSPACWQSPVLSTTLPSIFPAGIIFTPHLSWGSLLGHSREGICIFRDWSICVVRWQLPGEGKSR